jgi:2-polyprenyl-3-methyl-5-hydroxy-6-metoxy-1,4-benzoquinol methylase
VNHTRTAPAPTPRTAVIWAALRAEMDRRPHARLHVIDVGGGTGGFAVPLAEAGHDVTVIDASPDALASLSRRALDAGVAEAITALQGDGDQLPDLVEPASADIVLCHSVLEEVDDPAAVMAAVAASLRPGGMASVIVANRVSAALAKAIAGHLEAATAILRGTEPGQRRRFDSESAAALVRSAGLTVEAIHGVRVISDLVGVPDPDPTALLDFELAAAGQAPYRDIATQLHILARRHD